jgi:CRP-like cAMP-binding protein
MRAMAITVTPEVLAKVPLLSGLDRRALESFARTLKQRTFRAGQVALGEGESGVGFFIVLDGTAAVTIGGQPVRRLGPGDWFGEIALLTADSVRTATVTAETDVTCVGLTEWEFKPFLAEHPDVAWQIMVTMAHRIVDTSQG